MAAIAELDNSLQALRALKAPGVTKSRIKTITDICVENVKSESVLVQKIFTNFKRTPGTHKLGVIYVVDAVTRLWIEHAVKNGQDVSSTVAADGTFAAGVHRMTEMLPVLMNDLCVSAPDDQKDKILKLIDIWERGNIFPAAMLSGFIKKLNARASPPAAQNATQQSHKEATAERAPVSQVNVSHQGNPNTALQSAIQNGTGTNGSFATVPPSNQQSSHIPSHDPAPQANLLSQLEGLVPPEILGDTAKLTQYLQLLQQLQNMGIPREQWKSVITALDEQVSGRNPLSQPQFQTQLQQQPPPEAHPYSTFPPQTLPEPHRERSRSPVRRRGSPLRRRESPVYGTYRARSPLRSGSPSLQQDKIPLGEPKWTDYDPSLREGTIKVLSRTLFVGGVACSDDELRSIFSRFGKVQTVIGNTDKRHAFVKMVSRADAVTAREGMENNQEGGKIRSTRWGVGFGPRDCSDYQTGISIVPIDRLTEADKRWVLTAEYGGTGGMPISTGLVMEEPDIEIGAGVSSKAISARRFSPRKNDREGGRDRNDRGGKRDRERQHGDRGSTATQRDHSNRTHGQGSGGGNTQRGHNSPGMNQSIQTTAIQHQQPSRDQFQQQPQRQPPPPAYENTLGVPPAVPGFGGFQLPGMGQGGAYR